MKESTVHLTQNSAQTKKLGKSLAKRLFSRRLKNKAAVIGLVGDLGSGKTTFLQGFAKGLGVKAKILSPTFIIIRRMQLDNWTIGQLDNFIHIDAYRLRDARDLLKLGFREIEDNPKNVIVIEWADRVRKIMPKNTVWIDFKFISENERKITINNL